MLHLAFRELMNDELLPAAYLTILVVLLGGASIFILRQIRSTRRTESRISQLQSKLRNDPGSPQEYYELGNLYLQKKLYVQAVKLLQRALKDKTIEAENRALIHNALGYSYYAQEQFDLAIRQYKEAVKLYPEYAIAWNNLGNVYEKKNLAVPALDAYEQALAADPDSKIASDRAEALRKRVSPSGSESA